MPHAVNGTATTMDQNTVNGDKPHSVTLDHIVSYPLIADSLQYYQENPLGAKSITFARSMYSTFAVPVLPYLQTPYSIVSPYLAKADTIGDDTLSRVDSQFPGLKKTDFSTIKSHASSAASYPFKVAGEGKEYVFNTYDDEYKKNAGNGQMGIVVTGKAVITTEFRIVADAMRAVADWMGPQTEKAEAEFEKMKKLGSEKASKVKRHAHDKHDALVNSN